MPSSTQFFSEIVEQLDLAVDQLALRDVNFDRFAMMLIDNVVELTLHRIARERGAKNRLYASLGKVADDEAVVAAALGRHFDAKVRLAVKLGMLTEAAGESIRRLHEFRNEAHH